MPGPERRLIEYVHSQGAGVAVRAREWTPQDICDHIEIRALGPVEIVPKGIFGEATNCISTHDYLSLSCCWYDCLRSHFCEGMTIEFLPGTGWYDHGVSCPTYEKRISRWGDEFKKEYPVCQ